MRTRLIIAGATAVVALLAAGCGDGDDEAEETTTTEAGEVTTPSVPELSDEEFATEVDEVIGQVNEAGTEFCDVITAASASGPSAPPSSEEQVQATVEAQVAILDAIAASEPVDEANAQILRDTASELAAAAEADGYSEGFLEGEESTAILSSQEFSTAIASYQSRQASECGGGLPEGEVDPDAGAETVPEGSEGGADAEG